MREVVERKSGTVPVCGMMYQFIRTHVAGNLAHATRINYYNFTRRYENGSRLTYHQ